MSKKLILFYVLIFFLEFVSPLELGLSPAHFEIETNVGETACKNISLNSDRAIVILVNNKWAKTESRNLKDYNLSSENFGIEVTEEKIFLDKKKETEVCFSGEKAGNFYGVILFESENGYAGVGSWVELNVVAENKKSGLITGELIKDFGANNFFVLGSLSLVIEAGILFYFI